MTKLSLPIGALALIFSSGVGLASPAQASGPPRGVVVELCRSFVGERFFPSMGDCISGFRTFEATFCWDLKDGGNLEQYGFRNLGECVSAFRGY